MGCTQFDELLSAYADGETVPAQSEFLELHLATCGRCQQVLKRYQDTRRLLQSALDDRWIPPDLSRRVAHAYRGSRGIPWLVTVIGRLSVGAAALLVVALLVGRVGLLPSAQQVVPQAVSTVATATPAHCVQCSRRMPARYARVRGHVVPAMLASEVAYDLDSAIPMSQVKAQLLTPGMVDEFLRLGAVSKGGDSGRGQYVRSNGPLPL